LKEKIFFLRGGLGNQLFIYFAGRYLSQAKETPIVFNTKFSSSAITGHKSSIENLELEVSYSNKGLWTRKFASALNSCPLFGRGVRNVFGVFQPDEVGFTEEFESGEWLIFWGYFQSFRYLPITNTSIPRLKLSVGTSAVFNFYVSRAKSNKALSIHIRRGDYSGVAKTVGLLSAEYYNKAFAMAQRHEDFSELWIFTDAPLEAQKIVATLPVDDLPVVFIPSEKLRDEEVLILMSYAQSNIIANSSFSYFGAISNDTEGNVYYPKPWFKELMEPRDLCPPWWHAVDSSFENQGDRN
jgi:hypothetical protein